MLKRPWVDFCTQCRHEAPFFTHIERHRVTLLGKAYSVPLTEAICMRCGMYMCPPGLIDLNNYECDVFIRDHVKLPEEYSMWQDKQKAEEANNDESV